jgi:hypothetical protein
VDAHRFDSLARALAGSGSRRGILRGLAGAVASLAAAGRLSPAEAHHSSLGPGDPCRSDSQCVAADAPLICADNGFVMDGPLNCCTYEGSRCGFDQGCCWDLACVDGFCASILSNPGPGERCNSFSQCVAADTAVTCDFVAITGDYRCCAYEGSRCGTDAGCCGTAFCVDGFCAGPGSNIGPEDLVGPGDPCQYSTQCVAADTAVTCGYVGLTNDFRCCADEGGRCGWDGGCCGYARCTDAGFCSSLPPSGCDGEGCDCDFHDPNACAPGLVCCAVQSGFICATWEACGMG